MKSKKAHYGYYGLPILSIIIGIIFLVGLLILLYISELFGWIIIGCGLYVLVSYGISITMVLRKASEDFPDILKIEGNEYVLDVGCGLGRTSIEMFFLFTPFAFWQLLKKDDWIELLNKVDFVNLKYHYQQGLGYFYVKK